jgi:2-polyprenyl-6-methoxyphenol hydroxylase-like FAD-dependent oxidoreductase
MLDVRSSSQPATVIENATRNTQYVSLLTSHLPALSTADLDHSSFCSIAGLSLKPQRAVTLPALSIGDALTMTPPVTGNGMSMAFESAELAIEPLVAYSRGHIDWHLAKQQIARACDTRFARRLRWAQLLQWMMLSPFCQNLFGPLALRSRLLWQTFFHLTR